MQGCPSEVDPPGWKGYPGLSLGDEDGEVEGEESSPVVGVVGS